MIWKYKRRWSLPSNIAFISIFCLCLLIVAHPTLADDYDRSDGVYDSDQYSEDESSTTPTPSTTERTWKIGLDQVYFAPTLEEGATDDITDHPNKTYCRKDYWWRPYVEKIDPPPPLIHARYLRWKRSSIDTSNVTTTTNTANIFIGTYNPSDPDELTDREKPLYGHGLKRSVQTNDDDEVGALAEVSREYTDNESEVQCKLWRLFNKGNFPDRPRARRSTKSYFATMKATAPQASSAIYTSGRVKRMIKKRKKKVFTKTTTVLVKTTTKTTTSPKKITTMNPSRIAKIQKQIRKTAVPNLRKLTSNFVKSTTGVWDKLTGLPFYSTTAQWATPKRKSTQFSLIKEEENPKSEESDSSIGEYDSLIEESSLEAGDESIMSAESSITKSSVAHPKVSVETIYQVYDVTSPTPTLGETIKHHKKEVSYYTKSLLKTSTSDPDYISSPGPDASSDEVRRYWFRMKQKKKGIKTDEYEIHGKKGGRLTSSGVDIALAGVWRHEASSRSSNFQQSEVVQLLLLLTSSLHQLLFVSTVVFE